jgi:hypothetical protein
MAAARDGYRSDVTSNQSLEEPDVMEILDDLDDSLVCRICGALVARSGGYPRVHWDWHEASNGA